MMSYTSAKYGLSKRYPNRCVLHHCKFLTFNKSREDILYVRVSGHKSEASIKSYARKRSSSTKRAVSDTSRRATGVLASLRKKTTKNNQAALSKSMFTQTRLSNFKSFQFHHYQ